VDYEAEYEKLSGEVFATLASTPKRGYIPASDGVYFKRALVERALEAGRRALAENENLEMLRLARAMLLHMIGRSTEAEIDAEFLVARGGEVAKAARVLRKQIRASRNAI